MNPESKVVDMINQCCEKLKCSPEEGRKAALMIVDEILDIPEHRTETYEIMIGNMHTKHIQALSKHEREYWLQVKEQIKHKEESK